MIRRYSLYGLIAEIDFRGLFVGPYRCEPALEPCRRKLRHVAPHTPAQLVFRLDDVVRAVELKVLVAVSVALRVTRGLADHPGSLRATVSQVSTG